MLSGYRAGASAGVGDVTDDVPSTDAGASMRGGLDIRGYANQTNNVSATQGRPTDYALVESALAKLDAARRFVRRRCYT
jgi:hypothetical protein